MIGIVGRRYSDLDEEPSTGSARMSSLYVNTRSWSQPFYIFSLANHAAGVPTVVTHPVFNQYIHIDGVT